MMHNGMKNHEEDRKNPDIKKILHRLAVYLLPHNRKIIVAVLFEVLATIFTVISPKILGNITTSLAAHLEKGTTVSFADYAGTILLLVLLYLFSYFCTYLRVRIMVRVTQNIIYTMRTDAARKMARLPLSYYDGNEIGDIMSRITNDIDLVSSTLQSALTEAIAAIVIITGCVMMMLTLSPLLTIICLLTLPAGAVINTLIIRKSHRFFRDQSKYLGKLNGHIEETFTGHDVVRSLCAEQNRIDEFEQLNKNLYSSATKAQYASGTAYPLTGMVTDLSYIAICIIGAFSVLNKTMAIGDIQAMIQYSTKFADPIKSLSNLVNTLQSALAGAERLFDFLDEAEELPDSTAAALSSTVGEVDFQHVSFSYTPEVPLIEDFNLHVHAGDSIAIVGKTGAGKTTLVNLIMRFYEIHGGCITLDGTDIRQISRQELRRQCGMVLQDTWLFEGTIRENLLYGVQNPDQISDEALYHALEIAHLDHMIHSLPQGLDAPIKENGMNFSVGQRQLLTIARAILAQPTILILDEATSSVDTRTEQEIQTAMASLMNNRTSFIIAHRLATIRNAKTILVMDHGQIVEQGDHNTLMARKGAYYNLYHAQFQAKNT